MEEIRFFLMEVSVVVRGLVECWQLWDQGKLVLPSTFHLDIFSLFISCG